MDYIRRCAHIGNAGFTMAAPKPRTIIEGLDTIRFAALRIQSADNNHGLGWMARLRQRVSDNSARSSRAAGGRSSSGAKGKAAGLIPRPLPVLFVTAACQRPVGMDSSKFEVKSGPATRPFQTSDRPRYCGLPALAPCWPSQSSGRLCRRQSHQPFSRVLASVDT